MIRPGLVSITFRQFAVEEVCRLAADCGLEGIEWGADIHVPAGQLDIAAHVAALTRDHGLTVAAYGTYHKLGVADLDDWKRNVETAVELGARIARVWCGNLGSAEADEATRNAVVEAGRRAAEVAADAGITIACEWHGKTLTDSAASAQALFDAVDHPAFKTYWQPHQKMRFEDCLVDMDTALPRLVGLHVFQWDVETVERHPLKEGGDVWPSYFQKALTCPRLVEEGSEMFALIEFVRDDDPNNLAADAQALKNWLETFNTPG
ncbi:MAG: TIM barrel protein [Planctomycetota bacterium]